MVQCLQLEVFDMEEYAVSPSLTVGLECHIAVNAAMCASATAIVQTMMVSLCNSATSGRV